MLPCLLYTSDAADERSSVDLGGRRIIKKKKYIDTRERVNMKINSYTDDREHEQQADRKKKRET